MQKCQLTLDVHPRFNKTLSDQSCSADDNGFHATVTYEGEPSYGGRVGRAQGKDGRGKGGKASYRASNRVVQPATFAPLTSFAIKFEVLVLDF